MSVPLPNVTVDDVVALQPDLTLAVLNRDPVPGEASVPRDTLISLHIAEFDDEFIAEEVTRVWVNDVLAFDAGTFGPGFDGPRSASVFVNGDLRITIEPAAPFASEQLVEVRGETTIVDSSRFTTFRYSFTVEDLTAPQLLAATPLNPRTLRLSFNEPVRVTDLAGFAFERLSLPAVPLVAVAAAEAGAQVDLTLDTEMSPGRRYAVGVLGVADLSGNAILPPFNRASFEGFRVKPNALRRFDLWSTLPKHNRRQDVTGDLRRFIDCLQEVVDLLLADIDCLVDIFDADRAASPFLDLILADLGNPFPFVLDDTAKRRLAGSLVRMYRQKGTAVGIKNAVRFFLGIEIERIASFAGTPLVLGESELGVDWELGPSDRFSLYAFDVEVGVVLTETQRRQIRQLVDYLKPAHTHFIDLVEPTPPQVSTWWDLGMSELGIATELN